MEHQIFNLITTSVKQHGPNYFESQHGHIKSPEFLTKKQGFEILKKFAQEQQIVPSVIVHLMQKLWNLKISNLEPNFLSFFINLEEEKSFLSEWSEYYFTKEGFIKCIDGGLKPLLRVNEYSCPKRFELFFTAKSDGTDFLCQKQFKNEKYLIEWLDSKEGSDFINKDNRIRLINDLNTYVSPIPLNQIVSCTAFDLN